MNRKTQSMVGAALAVALAMFGSTESLAGLIPAGNYLGKSHAQWGLAWAEWGLQTGLGGQSLPNTLDGVRLLPPSATQVFQANVTLQPGTPVVFSPYVLFGEKYSNGTEDDPVALKPQIDQILAATTINTRLDGVVVLDGPYNNFANRSYNINLLNPPVVYAAPNPRLPAVQAFWVTGITAIFDQLSPGQHTIVSTYTSPFFSPNPFVTTYNITVVPEPAAMTAAVSAALALALVRRRVCST